MGEAKRRRQQAAVTVYHHTSTLRTNMIWMSGVIELEGRGDRALHPQFGEIGSTASLRRDPRDFPPLAWFTTEIGVPQCLLQARLHAIDSRTGERIDLPLVPGAAHAIALQRVSLGFPIADVPVTPWPDHPGYATDEGCEVNAAARAMGDEPDRWYVAERPVDVLRISEFRSSRSVMQPKLERMDDYIADIRRMVEGCRADPGAYIPPTWMAPDEVRQLLRMMDFPDPRAGAGADGSQ